MPHQIEKERIAEIRDYADNGVMTVTRRALLHDLLADYDASQTRARGVEGAITRLKRIAQIKPLDSPILHDAINVVLAYADQACICERAEAEADCPLHGSHQPAPPSTEGQK